MLEPRHALLDFDRRRPADHDGWKTWGKPGDRRDVSCFFRTTLGILLIRWTYGPVCTCGRRRRPRIMLRSGGNARQVILDTDADRVMLRPLAPQKGGWPKQPEADTRQINVSFVA